MLAESHIYILIDPRDGEVRYVGQSVGGLGDGERKREV